MQEKLIEYLLELKTIYEFKGLDFESDLVKMYGEVRTLMAKEFKENYEFGPEKATEIPKDVPPEEFKQLKEKLTQDNKAIKLGYDRVKQKIRDIRQDYRKAVTEGRRSGSGRIVCDNWDRLKNLWGGSPSTTALLNAIGSFSRDSDDENEDFFVSEGESQFEKESEEQNDSNTREEGEEEEKEETPAEEEETTADEVNGETSSQRKTSKTNPTPKFVDNKRKLLEKQLSASQRDQIYLNLAKEELTMKQNMVNSLADITKESNKAFSEIGKSIEKVGESIGNGLALLAQAFSGNLQRPMAMDANYYQQPHAMYQAHQPGNAHPHQPSPYHMYTPSHSTSTPNSVSPPSHSNSPHNSTPKDFVYESL